MSAETKTIIVVEDENGIRSAMVHALELRGHKAIAAADLEQAVSAAQTQNVDVLLSDLRLEGADGLEIARAVKKIQPQVRLVFMTGYGCLETAVQAIRLGASDYLTKPFRIEELLSAIEKAGASTEKISPKKQVSIPCRFQIETREEEIEELFWNLGRALRCAQVGHVESKKVALIIAEAIENSVQHAYRGAPGKVQVELRERGASLIGKVTDCGQGSKSSQTLAGILGDESMRGCGIRRMQESASDLKWNVSPGRGCTIEFRVDRSEFEPKTATERSSIAWNSSWRELLGWLRLQEWPMTTAEETRLRQVLWS